MFGLIKQAFISLLSFSGSSLASTVNAPNHTKCISLNNQQCMTQPSLVNLQPNDEYIEGLCYHLFAVNLDKCMRSCNTLNDPCNKVCVPNITKDLNLSVFNMITRINESKILTNIYHVIVNVNLTVASVTRIKSGIMISIGVSVKIWKSIMRTKNYIWNPATWNCENGEYLLISSTNDPVILWDEIVNAAGSVSANESANVTCTVPTNFHDKKN